MKNKPYRMLVHIDLEPEATAEAVKAQLKRIKAVELTYAFAGEPTMLLFAAATDPEACDDLLIEIAQIPGIANLRPRFLFSRVQTFALPSWPL